MNTTKKDKISKAKNVATFDIVNPNAAGIDIGSKEHWVCVPSDRDEKNVRKFSAFTHDLYNIGDWLQKCGITSVAMESTGVYWVSLFQVLDSKGFEVFLVNSSLTKSVPGRPKTDALDCQWIRRLHSCGLLRASFRPEDNVCKVRSLLRHRDNLIRSKSKTVNHMHKALEQMNIKITKVLSDITGVTGLKIINAILDGNRDFANIAACADPRIKASQDTIVKSLHGDYREEHLFTLKQSLHTYNFFSTLIAECDQQLESFLITLFQPLPLQMNFFDDSPTLSPRKKKSSNNQPSYNGKVYLKNISGVDLTKIPGVEVLTAQNFLFEVGLDMNKWPSEKHFSSWLAISPLKNSSGGKPLPKKKRTRQSRAAAILRKAASSLKNNKSYLGVFFRRIRARRGPAFAVTATAHKLAIIIYHMLKNKSEYRELGPDYLIKKNNNFIEKLKKQALSLGFSLVSNS